MFLKGLMGYLPANLLQAVVGFLTLSIFTRILSPEDYGQYALALGVSSLVYTLCFVWIEAAMARFYPAEKVEDVQAPELYGTLYRLHVLMAVAFLMIGGSAVYLWPTPTPEGQALKLAVAVGLLSIITRAWLKMAMEQRRSEGRVAAAAAMDMLQTGGSFLLGVGFVWVGLRGGAPLLGAGVMAALLLPIFVREDWGRALRGRWSRDKALTYAQYGLPITLSLVLTLGLYTVDRFMIAHFMSEADVGAFQAGFSLASRALDVLFIWLGAAGGPALINALETGGSSALRIQAKQQITLIALLSFPAVAGLMAVAAPLTQLLIGEPLRAQALLITPLVTLGALLSGLNTYYFLLSFTLTKKTRLLILAMAAPAVSNIILNLVLIPRMGLQGAALAYVISFSIGIATSWVLGLRATPLPFPLLDLAKIAGAAGVMALMLSLIPPLGMIGDLVVKPPLGMLIYGGLILGFDVCGARGQGRQLASKLASSKAGMRHPVPHTLETFRQTQAQRPRLSILAPFYKESPTALLKALGRDQAMERGDVEVILIDDGSGQADLTQAVRDCLGAQPYPATLITSAENTGRAAGRNHLINAARSDYFLFLDSDMLPDSPDFISTWLRVLDQDNPAVVFGGFSLDQATHSADFALHRAMASHSDTASAEMRRRRPEKYIFTSNLLIRADVLAMERFDPAFIGWGWEDVEWGIRVSKRWSIGHIDNTATHLGLDEAETLAAKYEQSVANFARLVAAHVEIVSTFPSYRVARALKRLPFLSATRSGFKAIALNPKIPIGGRAFAMRLYRAALYAQVV